MTAKKREDNKVVDTPAESARHDAYRRDGPFLVRPPEGELTEAEDLAWCEEMAAEMMRHAGLTGDE